MEVIKATFDPSDHPVNPPTQSVSEQQVKANIIPMHGLRIWDAIVRRMMRKKAEARARQLVTTVGDGVSGMVSDGQTTPAAQAVMGKEQQRQA